MMARTRPTAVNLFWSIDRMRSLVLNNRERTVRELQHLLEREAIRSAEEDVEVNRRIARHGKAVMGDRQNVLTYCNAGALATAGYGTALGVVRAACEAGRKVRVIACETRPVLQGARLTVWELQQSCIDVTLITDNMAGYMMKMGGVDVVVVGADRVAANGDVANKIGTYSVAVLAKEHGIPFYVAAPISTLDPELTSGDAIPIEEREGREVIYFGTKRVAPKSVETWNPAFDVTPSRLVTGIITERGIVRKPYRTNIKGLLKMG
jgi:methylthioribose-1-phosphate isomerase